MGPALVYHRVQESRQVNAAAVANLPRATRGEGCVWHTRGFALTFENEVTLTMKSRRRVISVAVNHHFVCMLIVL